MSASASESGTRAAYHHGDLGAALVAAGLAVLEEGGDPAALSLREAARRAGVSAMAPYRHFADKDALLAAIAEVGFARLRAALEAADGRGQRQGEPGAALTEQGVAYVGFACANPALFRLMFGARSGAKSGAKPGAEPASLEAAARAAYAVMAERVARLLPPEAAPDAALHCWATVHGLAALVLDGQLTPDLTGERDPVTLARRLLGRDFGPGRTRTAPSGTMSGLRRGTPPEG